MPDGEGSPTIRQVIAEAISAHGRGGGIGEILDWAVRQIEELPQSSPQPGTMAQQIAQVLNSHSQENRSNTPDFLLAEYLVRCLEAFEIATMRREAWYSVYLEPGRKWVEQKMELEP